MEFARFIDQHGLELGQINPHVLLHLMLSQGIVNADQQWFRARGPIT